MYTVKLNKSKTALMLVEETTGFLPTVKVIGLVNTPKGFKLTAKAVKNLNAHSSEWNVQKLGNLPARDNEQQGIAVYSI